MLDGILCDPRTSCALRQLSLYFPPWGTLYRWFQRWGEAGVLERMPHALTLADRERVGARPIRRGLSLMRRRCARAVSGSRACAGTIPPSASTTAPRPFALASRSASTRRRASITLKLVAG
ncbi:transposase [uncultured Methylobacterium sp.]|uniref:transposase n=1 Tax=Methylobacterium aquaticum TaxID=270351 RepID=UPI0009E4AD34